jgi:hypothetical protein
LFRREIEDFWNLVRKNPLCAMVKNLIWRLNDIDRGTSKDGILQYFESVDQARLRIKTLCPCVNYPEEKLTATIEYEAPPDDPEAPPRTKDDLPQNVTIDRDFMGLTPLYHPESGTYDAE